MEESLSINNFENDDNQNNLDRLCRYNLKISCNTSTLTEQYKYHYPYNNIMTSLHNFTVEWALLYSIIINTEGVNTVPFIIQGCIIMQAHAKIPAIMNQYVIHLRMFRPFWNSFAITDIMVK